MRPPPFASVIVPTYDRPEALVRCVGALREQDYAPDRFEIVVVDDGSPTPVVVERGDEPPRVTVVRQANAGPATARNEGVRRARGDILAFTDDDCLPRPAWLRHLVEALEREPDALVGGTTVNGLASNRWSQASQDLVSFLYTSFASSRRLRRFFTSNNLAATRACFEAIGGFDETFASSAAEDRDLSERWVGRGPLRTVEEAVVDHHHRLRASSFARQHFNYGRGAVHLNRRRRLRGAPPTIPEPLSFYARMLAYPIQSHGALRGAAISLLVGTSQVITVAGMVAEWLHRAPATLRDARTSHD